MMRFQHLLLLTAALASSRALPMSCSEDAHCPSGFYCDPGRLFCHQCLDCQHLMRVSMPATCVTKVAECGPCRRGLVERSNECAPPSPPPRHALAELPPSAWAVAALGLLALVLVCLAAAHMLRNFYTFKTLSCTTRASVRTPEQSLAVASAPPPPYDSVVLPLEPAGAALEESCPFISPVPVHSAREKAEQQAARVYNPPAYDLPDRPETDSSTNPLYQLSTALPADQEGAVMPIEGNQRYDSRIPTATVMTRMTRQVEPPPSLRTTAP